MAAANKINVTFPFGVPWENSFGQMLMSSCRTRNPLPHPWLGASGQGELKLPLSPVTAASSWLQAIIKAQKMNRPQDWFHLGPTTCPRINSNTRYHHHLSWVAFSSTFVTLPPKTSVTAPHPCMVPWLVLKTTSCTAVPESSLLAEPPLPSCRSRPDWLTFKFFFRKHSCRHL